MDDFGIRDPLRGEEMKIRNHFFYGGFLSDLKESVGKEKAEEILREALTGGTPDHSAVDAP